MCQAFDPRTRSELALPMFSGGEVMGVLNIESSRPNVFSPSVVRPVAWAASQMAVIWQNFVFGKYNWILGRLLSVVDRDSERSLKGIAEVAVESLGIGGRCDVWRYDNQSSQFVSAGASDGIISKAKPRADGWSHRVVARGVPVFI